MVRRILYGVYLSLFACAAAQADQAAAFFDDREVREIRLYFDDPNWYNTLLAGHRSVEDPYFPCRFRYGGTVIEQIGCRFKGHASFQRNGIKKPFKLDFNRYDDDTTFLGLKKLNLNNFDLSPDFMREKLTLDLASKYVAALRSVYVRLYVNDAFYGLYLAVEQPDKTMMQSRFGDDEDGNLFEAEEQLGSRVRPDLTYLGPDPSGYWNVYLLKTNEKANDYSGLINFLDILNNTPTADLPARLEPVYDVENWLYGMAVNNLVVNLDSYLGVGAEYYLYQRSSDGRFVHIQWDNNESFGITGDGTPRLASPATTDPFYLPSASTGGATSTARPLLQRLWAVNAYRRLYLQMMARFLREGFDPETMSARIQQLAGLIREHVYEDPNKAYASAQFEANLNTQVGAIPGLNRFIRDRFGYLRSYLNSQTQPADIRLNELVASNDGSARDEAGDADPWVELHNLGPGSITLNGFHLSDDLANPTKWPVPARTLADGGYLVLWLDGEMGQGDTHAGFRPQTGGGNLHLYANGTLIDTLSYPALGDGRSMTRVGLYGDRWAVTAQPTPGAANPAAAATPAPPGTGRLLINEFMADNKTALQDPDEPGAFDDWIEIYNPGAAAVDMSGMYLTDNFSNKTKYRIPDGVMIPAGGYLVFWADNDTNQGPLHTSFALAADGERIGLYEPDGQTLIDSVTFTTQQEDISFGRVSDGAAEWTIFYPGTPGAANAAPYANWIANAASYGLGPVAPDSITSAFGENLAAVTVLAPSNSLPNELGGMTVGVTDSTGAVHSARLFFVSATQVNFQMPETVAAGRATVKLRRHNGAVLTGDVLIGSVGPGLFSANASGTGVGLAAALRVDAAGAQIPISVFIYDAVRQRTLPVPISLGSAADQIYLTIYGTGIRGAQRLSDVKAQVGGIAVPVLYAAAQGEFAGFDQINVGPLPRSLAGKGTVEVELTVDNRRANSVTVMIE